MLRRCLMRVRPAPLSSVLKKLLCVRRAVVETPHGCFFVDPVSNFGDALIEGRDYEPAMRRTLETCLPPSGVFVDVGANEGFFSVVASSRRPGWAR